MHFLVVLERERERDLAAAIPWPNSWNAIDIRVDNIRRAKSKNDMLLPGLYIWQWNRTPSNASSTKVFKRYQTIINSNTEIAYKNIVQPESFPFKTDSTTWVPDQHLNTQRNHDAAHIIFLE
jgi:hypothetical protein